ncbi:MAG: hypothetical protein Q4G18_08640 [Myroides sp.]|nr:hypothetical protein [Myroides sp.]
MKSDTTKVFFDYPLDVEFTDEQLANRPALMESEIPLYYTAVKVDSDIQGDVFYKIMDELFIPEESDIFDSSDDPTGKSLQSKAKEQLMEALLYESYRLTGNEAEWVGEENVGKPEAKWLFGRKWYPSEKIQIFDDVVGRLVPLEGVQVLIRQWFTVRKGYTNANGDFRTGSVRGSARYVIQWENYDYSIRNGSFFQAESKGRAGVKNASWNYNIGQGSDAQYYGMIHAAAYTYYHKNPFGIRTPPKNSFWKKQMKIAARKSSPWGVPSSFSHIRSQVSFGLSAQIHIKEWGSNCERIFGTTIHELAHAAHWTVDKLSYDNMVRGSLFNLSETQRNHYQRLRETWPTTVETMFALERYRNGFNIAGYEYKRHPQEIRVNFGNLQRQTTAGERFYTSGGYDMLDNFNQREHGVEFPVDRVSGYTLPQLEAALVRAETWQDWRNNIKRMYPNNPTREFLDELFANWE